MYLVSKLIKKKKKDNGGILSGLMNDDVCRQGHAFIFIIALNECHYYGLVCNVQSRIS